MNFKKYCLLSSLVLILVSTSVISVLAGDSTGLNTGNPSANTGITNKGDSSGGGWAIMLFRQEFETNPKMSGFKNSLYNATYNWIQSGGLENRYYFLMTTPTAGGGMGVIIYPRTDIPIDPGKINFGGVYLNPKEYKVITNGSSGNKPEKAVTGESTDIEIQFEYICNAIDAATRDKDKNKVIELLRGFNNAYKGIPVSEIQNRLARNIRGPRGSVLGNCTNYSKKLSFTIQLITASIGRHIDFNAIADVAAGSSNLINIDEPERIVYYSIFQKPTIKDNGAESIVAMNVVAYPIAYSKSNKIGCNLMGAIMGTGRSSMNAVKYILYSDAQPKAAEVGDLGGTVSGIKEKHWANSGKPTMLGQTDYRNIHTTWFSMNDTVVNKYGMQVFSIKSQMKPGPDLKLNHGVKCEPKAKVCKKDSQETAILNFDYKNVGIESTGTQSTAKPDTGKASLHKSDTLKYIAEQFSAEGATAIEIESKFRVITHKLSKGTYSSGNILDNVSIINNGGSVTIPPPVVSGNNWKITISKSQPYYNILESLLSGKASFKISDTGVLIGQDTTYMGKYYVDTYLKIVGGNNNGNTSRFISSTLDTYNTPAMYNYETTDFVKFLTGPEEIEDDRFRYTSDPESRTNEKPWAVEIKHKDPSDERFEAMAGVPTTEDLYVGFGGTEFITAMEGRWKKQTATRKYTLTYTATSSWANNANCSGSCPGPVVNSKGRVTHPKHGNKSCGIATCQTHRKNSFHPGPTTFTCTFDQKIDEFSFMDIEKSDIWKLREVKLESPDYLFSNGPNFSKSMGTGYDIFVKESEYKSGNGRLRFSKSLNNHKSEQWGDTVISKSVGGSQLDTANGADATQWMQSELNKLSGLTVECISDYIIVRTTEGNQHLLYYTYKSKPMTGVPTLTPFSGCTAGAGEGGSNSYSTNISNLDEITIHWQKVPTKADMWTNNTNSSAKWDGKHITRSGFNGNFRRPAIKWDNINSTDNYIACVDDKLDNSHPNSKHVECSYKGATGSGNRAMTIKGMDITDSTDSNRNWSASDSIQPVYNGEHDTGNAYITYEHINSNQEPDIEGNYMTGQTDEWRFEVGYNGADTKVNNIVIHNPTSVDHAWVLSNDKKYDQRSKDSMEEDGQFSTNFENASPKCPRDASCEYSRLTCTEPGVQYQDSDYVTVQTGYEHYGGLNAYKDRNGNVRLLTAEEIANYRGSDKVDFDKVEGNWGGGSGFVHSFVAKSEFNLLFRSINAPSDPQGAIYINGSEVVRNDDSGRNFGSPASLDFGCQYRVHKGDNVSLYIYPYNNRSSNCHWIAEVDWSRETPYPNHHVCTPQCKAVYTKQLRQMLPHHYEAGQPYDPNDPNNHLPFGMAPCYSPCGYDDNHKRFPSKVKVVGEAGTEVHDVSNVFVNLDRKFRVYYPNVGDFMQQPSLHGIPSCTSVRGMGYYNGMDTTPWIREKYINFPFRVVAPDGKRYNAGEDIDCFELPTVGKHIYEFYIPLGEYESANVNVKFLTIANNAREEKIYKDNDNPTNKERYSNHAANHTAWKIQNIDVVGYIGNLNLADTGDFRFAELFKKANLDGSYLIPNLVRTVNPAIPNFVMSDRVDIRGELSQDSTKMHNTYGETDVIKYQAGKGGKNLRFPLTPAKNNIPALRNQPMRPGYQLYMDIETVGNYYGENWSLDSNNWSDDNLIYRMELKPHYYALNTLNAKYTPIDIYMGSDKADAPVPVYNFYRSNSKPKSEWYYYLDMFNDWARRNTTESEKSITADVTGLRKEFDRVDYRAAIKNIDKVYQGDCEKLILNDNDRDFIGSMETYGQNWNGYDWDGNHPWHKYDYGRQSQRWYFGLGIPSSAKFVEANKPPTKAEFDKWSQKHYVIVCTLGIAVKGTVWSLKYNANKLNNAETFKITPNDKVAYPIPPRPTKRPEDYDPNVPTDEQVITVYNSNKTARDDLDTRGTH